MTPRLAILSGARAGAVEPLPGAVASIGRHATCQVRLDPDADVQVSSRHAVIQRRDAAWVVRDLGSAQGTYVNGQRIEAEQPLNDGDVLRLGAEGPELQFLLSDRAVVAAPSAAPTAAQPGRPTLSPEELARILEEEQAGLLAREMAAAARRRQLVRIAVGTLVAITVVTTAVVLGRRAALRRAEIEASTAELARADSLMASVATLRATTPAMQAALDSARQSARRLRMALDSSGHRPEAIRPLMTRLDSAVGRQRVIAAAAAFDAPAIAAPSAFGVAFVVAQYADGSEVTATASAVRRDGTGVVLLTSRAVGISAASIPPDRVLVRYPGVAGALSATVLATHLTEDLALLRVAQRGGLPVVQGLGWKDPPLAAGAPVAVTAYAAPAPAGDGDWAKASVVSSTTTGTAVRVTKEFITVDGWGAALAAGAPVFDAEGLVAGVVSSAAPSSGGRLYDVVPVIYALELLDQLQ